ISGGCEDNLHLFFDQDFYQLVNVRIKQRYVHAKWLCGVLLTRPDMLPEYFRIHRARAEQAQTTGVANCCCEAPAATPNHPGLDDRILNSKEPPDPVRF